MKDSIYPSSFIFDEPGMEVSNSPRRKQSLMERIIGAAAQDRALQTAERDFYRSFLTAKALQNTAALSMFERDATNLTPQSAERFRAIIDAYTNEAVKTIKGW